MSNPSLETLTLDKIRTAVSGTAAAFRCVTKLEPAGGPGDKIFPPTYSGGVYAKEQRRIRRDDGSEEVVSCVLVDSVQSQANRFEEQLLDAYEDGDLKLPVLAVDFGLSEDGKPQKEEPELRRIGRITSLETPHRIADAILRDSITPDGKPFRESKIGKAFEDADIRHATALFQYCPTALIFGTWDSTGSRGGLGNKFARALVSEIVGINAEIGVRTSSRIDPLQIGKCDLYEDKNGGWTVHEKEARLENKKPVRYGGSGDKGKPSAINHGNVTPSIEEIGGVTISHALQTTVLSLAQLRRLRFPDADGNRNKERDEAARTVLATLALTAIALSRQGGADLRSRCLLVPATGQLDLELVQNSSEVERFELSPQPLMQLFQQAVARAKEVGLPWAEEIIVLRPMDRLVELVLKGRHAAAVAEEAAS